MADTDTLTQSAEPPAAPHQSSRRSRRRLLGALVTGLAVVALWIALDLPDRPEELSGWAFARIPLELLALVVVALVLPGRVRTVVAALAGLGIALVLLLKALDIGMLVGFYRTFDPLSDPAYAGAGYGVLRDSVGSVRAVLDRKSVV